MIKIKKQIILNIEDNSFYLAKLILSSLYNRKQEKDPNTVEILINCSKILERRLDIPNLKYTNDQIENGSRVYISFPFESKLFIKGDNVFNINNNRSFEEVMEELCEYLDIRIDLKDKKFAQRLLLTLSYIEDFILNLDGDDITFKGAELLLDNDLINFTILATTPTLKLGELIKTDDKEEVYEKLNGQLENADVSTVFDELTWEDLGTKLLLFPDIELPDDVELNSRIFKKLSRHNNSRNLNIVTSYHMINLLSQQVVTGENPVYKLPKIENPKFSI